ncbi:MAG: hypothetical protein ACRD3Q_00305 [Terriglobales bacterium]
MTDSLNTPAEALEYPYRSAYSDTNTAVVEKEMGAFAVATVLFAKSGREREECPHPRFVRHGHNSSEV